jgi:hypothetical protein
MDASIDNHPWHPVKRFLFRFAFAYLVLYSVFLCAGGLSPIRNLLDAVVPWVGQHVFQVNISPRPLTPRGDLTFDYVQVFCFLMFAAGATVVWTLLDRKRSHYTRLSEWLYVGVRLVLAWQMILYGAVKVIPSQFGSLLNDTLLQSFGETNRMGLLWTFMAASNGYTVFTGAAEILGGLLLTTRRTALLGTLVCIGVMSNVVMLNFGYDVCVKIHSSHLLAMAVFLILPDLGRLADFFLHNRRGEPAPVRPLLAGKWFNRVALVLRTVFFLYITYEALMVSYEMRKTYGDLAPRPALAGIWNVEEFEIDGEVRPPLLTDASRWRRAIIDNYYGQPMFGVQLMNDAREGYALEAEADTQTLTLTNFQDPAQQTTLTYRELDHGALTVEGMFDGHKIRAKLHRVDESRFALKQGNHWISD